MDFSQLKRTSIKAQAIDDPHLSHKKKEVALRLGKQMAFALRSLELNSQKKNMCGNPTEEFETLRSMNESFRVCFLAVYLESKSRFVLLTRALGRIRQSSQQQATNSHHKTLTDLLNRLSTNATQKIRNSLFLLIRHHTLEASQRMTIGVQRMFLRRFVHMYQAKAWGVLKTLLNDNLNGRLTAAKKHVLKAEIDIPLEPNLNEQQDNQPTGKNNPLQIQKWLFQSFWLSFKIKTLNAFQVLRFPTIKRHEKQKAVDKLETIIHNRISANNQLAINSMLRKKQGYQNRYLKLCLLLDARSVHNLQVGWFSLRVRESETAQQLLAVQKLSVKILNKQKSFDKDLSKSCFMKLADLMQETSLTRSLIYKTESLKLDSLIEKKKKLESENNPKILQKINLKKQNGKLIKQIETAKIENTIYLKNISNLNESTRRLTLKKDHEVRQLITRQRLDFCYAGELRKALGNLFGPSKIVKNEQTCLSQINDNVDATQKAQNFDHSISKNGDLEDSSVPNLGNEQAKFSNGSEIMFPEISKIGFKLNNSEKLLREIESKKFIKKLKEMNFEGFLDNETENAKQTKIKLATSRSNLESVLEELVSKYAELQQRLKIDVLRVDELGNHREKSKQKYLRTEMNLIDHQDRKGMLNMEKSMAVKKNEKEKKELELIQKLINDSKNKAIIESTEANDSEKLQSEFFEKHTLIQTNSQNVLKLDQEMLEVSRVISHMTEQNKVFKALNKNLEERKLRLIQQTSDTEERMTEIREEIKEVIRQMSWNASLVESIMTHTKSPFSANFETNSNNLDLEGLERFKNSFLQLGELRLFKSRQLLAKNEIRKEQASVLGRMEIIGDQLEDTGILTADAEHSLAKIVELTTKQNTCSLEMDQLTQKLASADSETRNIEHKIDCERDKLKQVMMEVNQGDNPAQEDSRRDLLSKNTMYMSTRLDFGQIDQVQNSTIRENLLNLSKSCLTDESIRPILIAKLNPEILEHFTLAENNLIANQSFDEILHLLIEKKKTYLQNNQLSYFNFLKKEEIDSRIKSNSCEILDFKEKLNVNELAIRNWRKLFHKNCKKLEEVEFSLREYRLVRFRPISVIKVDSSSVTTQTDIESTFFKLNFAFDKIDMLNIQKKGLFWQLDGLLDPSAIPKWHNFHIQQLDPIIQMLKVDSNKVYKNYLEFEQNDLFDGKNSKVMEEGGIEFDLNNSGNKDSLLLDEFFPTEIPNRKSVKKLALRRQSPNCVTVLGVHSYQHLHDTIRNDQKMTPMIRLGFSDKSVIRRISVDNSRINALEHLAKLLARILRGNANLNFYHLQLIASNTRLQTLMRAINQFKLNQVGNKFANIKGQLGAQLASGLLDVLAELIRKRRQTSFNRIKAILDARNKRRNLILTKWMVRGDALMKKHLRLTMQYWKHVKDDNIWNVNILKTMAVKCPLIPQVALWRMMLYKKRDYKCDPKLVKGLLQLISVIDTKYLNQGYKCIYYCQRPVNDFDTEIVIEKSRKCTDPCMLQSELIANRKSVNNELGIKSQKLYSMFSYFGILNKRILLKFFYKFIVQVRNEPVKGRLVRFEPKSIENEVEKDAGIRTVRFLLDQQIKTRIEINDKESVIQDLREELSEKQENLSFLHCYLLNFALSRLERIAKRVFNKNAEHARFVFMNRLSLKIVKEAFK